MGRGKGLHAAARRRQAAAGAPLSAHRPLQGAQHRIAGGLRQGQRPRREGAAGAAGQGPGVRQGSGPCPHRQAGRGVLDQARLPLVRPQLPRARPAAVFLQLEARLVRRLLRHRPEDRRRPVGRGARAHRRRGQRARFLDRVAGDRPGLPAMRGTAAQPRGARRPMAGKEHFGIRGNAGLCLEAFL